LVKIGPVDPEIICLNSQIRSLKVKSEINASKTQPAGQVGNQLFYSHRLS